MYLIVEVPNGSSSSFTSLSVNCNAYVGLVYPSTSVIFRHRYGLPIKVSAKAIAMLKARCAHDMDNNLSVAIKPNKIEWRIEGEKKCLVFSKSVILIEQSIFLEIMENLSFIIRRSN